MKLSRLATLIVVACPFAVFGQGLTAPIDVTADTGAHTCTAQGQDHKNYKTVNAGEDRYFVDMKLTTVSVFGSGACEFSPDHPPGVKERVFCVTDADGKPECQPRPVEVVIRAYADCTNNLSKLGSRVGTECRFTATSKRGKPQ